jgi:hypothetical protein
VIHRRVGLEDGAKLFFPERERGDAIAEAGDGPSQVAQLGMRLFRRVRQLRDRLRTPQTQPVEELTE